MLTHGGPNPLSFRARGSWSCVGGCGIVRWLKFEWCDTKIARLQIETAGGAVGRVGTVMVSEVGA